jgi:VRR-NUC domain-containing protein
MSGIATASLLPDPPKRRADEESLHRQVVRFLQWALPADATFYHPANGGLRSKVAAARMVGLGVRAGIPDLAIVWKGRALFIELKAPKGGLSAHQRQMINRLIYCGAEVMVCKTLEGVECALRELGVPLRASVMPA